MIDNKPATKEELLQRAEFIMMFNLESLDAKYERLEKIKATKNNDLNTTLTLLWKKNADFIFRKAAASKKQLNIYDSEFKTLLYIARPVQDADLKLNLPKFTYKSIEDSKINDLLLRTPATLSRTKGDPPELVVLCMTPKKVIHKKS